MLTQSNDKSVIRDGYAAILDRCVPAEIHDMLIEVVSAAGWEIGITSDNNGWTAQNLSVYGYDVSRNLAVIQMRRAGKWHEWDYPVVIKAYALVGMDDGRFFTHILPSSPTRNPHLSEMMPEQVVTWAECKIFGVSEAKLAKVIRHGDIGLVPASLPADARLVDEHQQASSTHKVTLRDSLDLIVTGNLYRVYSSQRGRDEYIFRGTGELNRNKNEHRPVTGTYRVILGRSGDKAWWLKNGLSN